MIHRIRNYLGKSAVLNQKRNDTPFLRMQLSAIRSVGIIAHISNSADLDATLALRDTFLGHGKTDMRLLAISHDAALKHPGIDIIHPNDLRWNRIPKSSRIAYFIHQPIDLLINLSTSPVIAIHYLAASTPAKLKIGPDHEEYWKIYHLLFHVGNADTHQSLAQYIVHYLEHAKWILPIYFMARA